MGGITGAVGGFLGNAVGGLSGGLGLQAQNPFNPQAYADPEANQALQAQQQDLANMLKARASGQTQSVSELMLQRALQQQQAQTMGQAAALRGSNPGLALRNAQINNSMAAQQTGQEAAIARIQEQQQGQSLYAQQLSGMRQQALNNTGLWTGVGQQNAENKAKGNAAVISGIAPMFSGFGGKGGGGGSPAGGGIPGGSDSLTMPQLGSSAGYASAAAYASGGMVPNLKENYADGGMIGPQSMAGRAFANASSQPSVPMTMRQGGVIPGQAQVSGDSLKNDKVPIMASPGEIVIPRSVAQAKNAPDMAAQFVEAVLSRKRRPS